MNCLKPVKLMGLEFKNPLTNASGVISDTLDSLNLWYKAGVGGLFTKGPTFYERKPKPFDWKSIPPELIMIRGPDYGVNTMGLPNSGLLKKYAELKKSKFKVPLFCNVTTGTGNPHEYPIITNALVNIVDGFEINVSCPNTEREIIGYNLESLEEVLSLIEIKNKPISIKLPCYGKKDSLKKIFLEYDEVGEHYLKQKAITHVPTEIDDYMLRKILDLIDDRGFKYKCVTSHNTYPTNHPLLGKNEDGSDRQGGLSGRPIREIAIKQLKAIKENSDFDVIYSGGAMNSQDVKEALDNGASLVQLGTVVFRYDSPYLLIKAIKEGN
jgi:dihydroorotate dehydrogenase (NAD+) catalytic subunit